jgi:CDP-glucose 4,6-dehydratase
MYGCNAGQTGIRTSLGNKEGSLEDMVDATLNTFYSDKKIFLTGHTGFKGSWMLTWLTSMNAVVKGYSLPPENKNDLYNIIDGNSICDSIYADIREKDKLKKELIQFQPDIVFHMAAQPLVRYSYQNPLETFEINSMGTAYLLDSLKSLEKKCAVVIITTDKVYINKESNYSYIETDSLGGFDPYSASKAAAEIITSSYRSSFFNTDKFSSHHKAIATARAGNVIGGGDWNKDRIIPDVVNALQKKETIIVRNPNSIRPWQHVLESINGYLLLAKELYSDPVKFSGAWNFGPEADDTLSVKSIVENAIKIWGSGSYEISKAVNQPHEANLLMLDINKAKNELNWKPRYKAAEAIERTISWYKHSEKEQKEFVYKQLNDFIN